MMEELVMCPHSVCRHNSYSHVGVNLQHLSTTKRGSKECFNQVSDALTYRQDGM